MKLRPIISLGLAILFLGIIVACFSELGSDTSIREKVIASTLGAAISGLLAVTGWMITFKNSLEQQAITFENQNYERILSKLIERITSYLNWMHELNGRIDNLKQKGSPVQLASMVEDWNKFSEFFSNMQAKDPRNKEWSDSITVNLPVLNGFPFFSFKALLIRQLHINTVTRSFSYCSSGETHHNNVKNIEMAYDNQKYVSEQVDQVSILKQFFVQEYHQTFFRAKARKEMFSEIHFDPETGVMSISERLQL